MLKFKEAILLESFIHAHIQRSNIIEKFYSVRQKYCINDDQIGVLKYVLLISEFNI